jgi:hypothetical protein
MLDQELEMELAEYESWRAFRNYYVTCEVCSGKTRWTAWAWVNDTNGNHVRACYDCLGKSVLLLPSANRNGGGADG